MGPGLAAQTDPDLGIKRVHHFPQRLGFLGSMAWTRLTSSKELMNKDLMKSSGLAILDLAPPYEQRD